MLTSPHREFHDALAAHLPASRIFTDALRTAAYGADAGFYKLPTKIVVRVESEDEVIRCLGLASAHRVPVTFRAGGTSLSGQSVTDSVLLALGDGWRGHALGAGAATITLEPGVIGAKANALLAPLGRRIGPDPASINAARIGGIAANNASGMCCGVAQNTYHTLASMRVVLADGTVLDTGDPLSRERFTETRRDLLDALDATARRVRADEPLAARIRHKYRIKNTTGYSLNALVDFADPFDVLQHLMVGSEGTLGFISSITLNTVEEPPCKATCLAFFPDVHVAGEAVAALASRPVAAVELMDRASLRAVEDKPGMPDYLPGLPAAAAALLVETRAGDADTLGRQIEEIAAALAGIETLRPIEFTDDAEACARLWNVRKGLFPSVGAVRETGTTVVIEDVAFPVARLADATVDLQGLFARHGYDRAIIFGHALEGNLHFVFTQDFGDAAEVERYRGFMDALCHLVVDTYDGSLKAEHGTGRNIAPFVELEWQRDARELMREIKTLFDPAGILNPGVVVNDDREVHLKNLKPLPAVDPLVDKCIECGFCEPTCPSRALTFTPRQRIVALREIARAGAGGADTEALRALFDYPGLETCAGCGLCSLACPVGIDTGRMIKVLRGRRAGALAHRVGRLAARHFGPLGQAVRLGLAGADLAHAVLGSRLMGGLARGARAASGGRIPLWTPWMPRAARLPAPAPPSGDRPRIVYLPSCASRTMGPARGDPERDPLPVRTDSLLRKAGYDVVYPAGLEALCCGMPFESKGLIDDADAKLREAEAALDAASRGGRDPIVCDTSPCAFRFRRYGGRDLGVIEIGEFIHDHVLERVAIDRRPGTVAVHTTCSARKMGLESKLEAVARACAERVIVPEAVGCCGWAGDKGFNTPELNASALRDLRAALPGDCEAGYSTSRTCEIGLSEHGGIAYRSIVYLVDACARPRGSGA